MLIAVKIKEPDVNKGHIVEIVGTEIPFEIFNGCNDTNVVFRCDKGILPVIISDMQDRFGSSNVCSITQ